jgi:hypothetical protein
MNLYLGLVHHPIKNKRDELVTTSVTNLDIHDISRSCKTYGVKNYFIITPIMAQQALVERILGHWKEDKNGAYNPDRQDALDITICADSLSDVVDQITKSEGVKPLVVVTGANFESFSLKAEQLQEKASLDKRSILLLFGTGWGLYASALELADIALEPIFGNHPSGYNHLSVRSAVAIYLDRIYSHSKL